MKKIMLILGLVIAGSVLTGCSNAAANNDKRKEAVIKYAASAALGDEEGKEKAIVEVIQTVINP